MMTDPISDMLTRIRNASMVHHTEVLVPYSKVKHQIARVLETEGYISSVKVDEQKKHPRLSIGLKYKGKIPHIREIKRISKPGLRVYVKRDEIPRVRAGYGMAVLSTSQGIMTDTTARESGVGGEVICTLY